MNRMYLVLGDWSNDGHEKSSRVLLMSDHTVDKIQDAYLDSCKLTGMSFHGQNAICSEYENNILDRQTLDLLKKYNYPDIELDSVPISEEMFVDIWIWFVKLTMDPTSVLEVVPNCDVPVINGYWNERLNKTFGYGIF